jgi:APA family basic amino acid/polyamine antiporter
VTSTVLDRRLGPVDAAAIIISNVVGSGIFLTPAVVASLTGDAVSMLAVWIAGGLIAFAGAMAYAELAVLRPQAGGEHVYLREAFGPVAAFLTGWTSFVAGFSGAIAASAVGSPATSVASFPLPATPARSSRFPPASRSCRVSTSGCRSATRSSTYAGSARDVSCRMSSRARR